MNDKLTKKVAKWVGFRQIPQVNGESWTEGWLSPDGTRYGKLCPDFPNSLDACFKWLIYPNQGGLSKPPSDKIINWRFSNQKPNVGAYMKPRAWLSYCKLLDKDKNIWSDWQYAYAEDDYLAVALCLALEQLIDKERE